jgi:hypothetical protein
VTEKEDLHERLRSLRARLAYIIKFPMPFDHEARVRNLRAAIKSVQDRIGQESIDWRQFGF